MFNNLIGERQAKGSHFEVRRRKCFQNCTTKATRGDMLFHGHHDFAAARKREQTLGVKRPDKACVQYGR